MRYLVLIFILGCAAPSDENLCECKDNGGPWIALAGQSNAKNIPLELFTLSVVRVAAKGTGVEEWQPDGYYFNELIDCMFGYPIQAIVFIQGEKDARKFKLARTYQGKLENINQVVPLTIVLTSAQLPYTHLISAAQLTVNPFAIKTEDLETSDGVHYTLEAQKILVERIEKRIMRGAVQNG